MPEAFEISYHPVDQEDPNNPHSEAYQNKLWHQATGRAGWPGAVDLEFMLSSDHRAHLVVVQGLTKAVRILRAPLGSTAPNEIRKAAMTEVMEAMRQQYPPPEYDMTFGGSCLADVMRTFPLAGYHDFPIEDIVLTPK